ncbi:MAG: SAM-dependent methyltransferase, partial [Allobaculum sp.]|nr:SAM-dependent methyltransferase [Allobaculum sp.]
PLPYKLNVTNQLLHGIELPNLRNGDSLSEKKLSDFRGDDFVDFEITNVPFGGVALPEDLNSFPSDLRSSETADMFVALNVKRLKENGRAMIVLPDGFLFGTDKAKQNIKKYLLENCNLHTVIRLPQSVFAPYTSIATNLLFFDKTESTQETWFYRLDMPEGYKHFSKTKPIKLEHFAPVEEWWKDRKEIKDEKTDTFKAKKYTIEEIKERNYDIDLCGYPNEEKEILPPRDLIAQYEKERSELNAEIDEVLQQITELLGFSLEDLR